MAMITCPSCGEAISDKAPKCVHCGYVFEKESKIKCSECGTELEEGAIVCPICGCPIEDDIVNEEISQKDETIEVHTKPSTNKKTLIIAVVAVVAFIAIVGACFGVNKIYKQKTVEKYGENLKSVTYLMLSGAVDAETCCNLIKDVWYNTIYKERDSDTDKYTHDKYGYFNDDFNDSLSNLFDDDSFKEQVRKIESNQYSVQTMMKDLKTPPDEWKSAYDDLQNYYDAYLSLTNMATNPKGSLQTYSSNFASADSNVSKALDRMKIHLD